MQLPPLPFSIRNKTVLISSLNWGLGHAARSSVIIKELLRNDARVIIAGDGKAAMLLQSEFPELEFYHLASHEVSYDASGMSIISIIKQLPKLIHQTNLEYTWVQKHIDQLKIDLIISDNRYGFRSKNIYSIIICHQISLLIPKKIRIFQKSLSFLHRQLLNKFNECWIPDYQTINDSLAGILSHPRKTLTCKTLYINPLSRIQNYSSQQNSINFDILILLSGPEPQRTILESLIYSTLKNSNLRIAMLRGTTEATKYKSNFSYIQDLATGNEIAKLMSESRIVISRSGYSTIMDIHCLNKLAIIIPTPQQTEQEYLAKHLSNRKNFKTIHQTQITSHLLLTIDETLRNK